MDGNTVAVAGYCDSGDSDSTTVPAVSTYNLISGTRIDSHRFPEEHTVVRIWTHGEFLRFATVESGSITIWEAGSTSEHTLVEIEVLPAPDNIDSEELLFLPTPSRIAFIPLGAKGNLPSRYIVSLLWVLKQFAQLIPSR